MLERMGGLQAQYAPSMYVGLWTRLEGFERRHLDTALERRSVVQGTLMRSTIHLVSAREYWSYALALREGRRESWLRGHRGGPTADQVAAAAKRLRRRLANGPMSRAEVGELVGDSVMINAVGQWLEMVRVPPSGTWERRRADIYAAAEEWIGKPGVKLGEAREDLVRAYLRGFGPSPVNDIAGWAGIPPKEVEAALKRLRLRRFRSQGGDELLDLPRAPLPAAETPAPPRLLPVWDATLLVHARRTGVLPEEHRPKVFNTRTPQSVNTFLVDGAVAGTWRHERGRIGLEPFGRLPKAARRELDEEADRLALLHA